jgi:hypothetical protein
MMGFFMTADEFAFGVKAVEKAHERTGGRGFGKKNPQPRQ